MHSCSRRPFATVVRSHDRGMAAKDELGAAGEDRAVQHLRAGGYRILDRNWRCADGELDIVARRDTTVVVVEVKTRRTLDYGDPLAAVDARKLTRLWRLAHAWVAAHPEESRGCGLRIDVVGIVGAPPGTGELVHLRDVR